MNLLKAFGDGWRVRTRRVGNSRGEAAAIKNVDGIPILLARSAFCHFSVPTGKSHVEWNSLLFG